MMRPSRTKREIENILSMAEASWSNVVFTLQYPDGNWKLCETILIPPEIAGCRVDLDIALRMVDNHLQRIHLSKGKVLYRAVLKEEGQGFAVKVFQGTTSKGVN